MYAESLLVLLGLCEVFLKLRHLNIRRLWPYFAGMNALCGRCPCKSLFSSAALSRLLEAVFASAGS